MIRYIAVIKKFILTAFLEFMDEFALPEEHGVLLMFGRFFL